MDITVLVDLCRASDQANDLLLSEVEKLDPAELRSKHSPSHGSVWNLLRHMLMVETHYLQASQGKTGEFEPPSLESLADLRCYWQEIISNRQDHISSLSPDQVGKVISLRLGDHDFNLPRHQIILQGILHSVYHRGELSIVMTDLGYPLPTLDSIVYFVKESGQEWPDD